MSVQIRIVALVLALSFLAASILVAYRYLKQEWIPEQQVIREIEEHYEEPPTPPDPGIKYYAEALALVRDGQLAEGKDLMEQLMRVFPDSNRVPYCRQVIGEMNMDRLLSRLPVEGKLEYVVKPGDALSAIAKRNRTTISYMRQVNTMQNLMIHPGDRFVLYPLEFDSEIDVEKGELTLLRSGKFFKSYQAEVHGLPEGLSSPRKMMVSGRGAWIDGARIPETDERLLDAHKWVECTRKRSPIRLVLASASASDELREQFEAGFFFADSDMEEIYTVLRTGLLVSLKN